MTATPRLKPVDTGISVACLCDEGCELITVEGSYCGDGLVQPGEVCDPLGPEQNCGAISAVFLGHTTVGCLSDCSAWIQLLLARHR